LVAGTKCGIGWKDACKEGILLVSGFINLGVKSVGCGLAKKKEGGSS